MTKPVMKNNGMRALLDQLISAQQDQMKILTEIRIESAEMAGRITNIETKLTGQIAVITEKLRSCGLQLDWNWRLWLAFLGGSGVAFGIWKALV